SVGECRDKGDRGRPTRRCRARAWDRRSTRAHRGRGTPSGRGRPGTNMTSRRTWLRAVTGALGAFSLAPALAAAAEIKVPANVPEEKLDFEAKGIDGWSIITGQWSVEAMPG